MRIRTLCLSLAALTSIAQAAKSERVTAETAAVSAPFTQRPGPLVATQVDWPEFLQRHDLIWERLPEKFDHGAFAGNGRLGTTIYRESGATLRFAMGRSGITEHRRDNGRIVIDGLQLKTSGKIVSGALRTDLWNAEVRGTVTTDAGAVTFRAFVHAKEPVIVIDFSATGNETATWNWDAAPAAGFQDFKDPPSLQCDFGKAGETDYCEQKRAAGGAYTAAWKIEAGRVLFTLADTFPGEASEPDTSSSARLGPARPLFTSLDLAAEFLE